MGVSVFTPNIQLSEFALKIREYRLKNNLTTSRIAAQLGVSEDRIFALEVDNAMPTFLEKFRFNRLIAKQKTATPK